ncbi:unnamed protein product [Darwinula stevensoni]|uniref:START domain-containing protein n=1 Tax=Darwinula stevensoni TaxID=69355 RepID=A0A7R9AAA9_9CRUS|nr:unnamed protein product [Darwinula stevensoni]CAG0898092.1 unnamed protein product [Darwinula stevensoni]
MSAEERKTGRRASRGFPERSKNVCISYLQARGSNHIGILRGTEWNTSRDEILVLGAHYDTDGSVTSGMNDNGSGVLALLKTAEHLKNLPDCSRPSRTVLFVAFDFQIREYAEESGGTKNRLPGSKVFVEEFLVPHLERSGGKFLGAIILDSVMNHNDTPFSQILPRGFQQTFPEAHESIERGERRGDFLLAVGREGEERDLMVSLNNAWMPSSSGSTSSDVFKIHSAWVKRGNANPSDGLLEFLRQDHLPFWHQILSSSSRRYPAVLLTDTGRWRGKGSACRTPNCDPVEDFLTPGRLGMLKQTVKAFARLASQGGCASAAGESHESFSNPIAPPTHDHHEDFKESHRLTNEDFRKLLMTPRATPAHSSVTQTPIPHHAHHQRIDVKKENSANLEKRKQKKRFSWFFVSTLSKSTITLLHSLDFVDLCSYYAKLKRDEEDTLAELAKKYRDRAQERREGISGTEQEDPLQMSAGYRAVAPDLKSGMDAAERRRQMIQESKFLGGDMEHTHLVKGLDYALLQKEEEDELEKLATGTDKKAAAVKKEEEEENLQFKTKLGRSVYRILFKTMHQERNELFLPGRMAYIIDLEDEFAESDIPTTLIRSKADCPNIDSATTMTTNDIVINKLTQILSYLRHGHRSKKKQKKEQERLKTDEKGKAVEDTIYGDIGDYVPSLNKSDKDRSRDRYPVNEMEAEEKQRDKERDKQYDWRNVKVEKDTPAETKQQPGKGKSRRELEILSRSVPEGYAECYPGLEEMNDAIEDSDEEVDYTKMDMGNKKGPIGRWDFETQEEYSDYMSRKEALPKAAFQYGVKMADGRKTRRIPKSEKNERAELDREWKKIQRIIEKRKTDGSGFGLLKSTLTENDWRLDYSTQNLQVWTKASPFTHWNMIKLKASFPDIDASVMFDVLLDPEYRKVWDRHVVISEDIGYLDANNDVGYYAATMPFSFLRWSLTEESTKFNHGI